MRRITALHSAAIALVAIMFTTLSSPSQAATCSIRLEIVKAGFIFGASGGGGTLNCGGRSYALSVGGVSIGATIGASQARLVGRAYNVRQPSDVEGVYGAAAASVAVVRGRGAVRLSNPKGVVLELRGREVGLEFSLDLSGMAISLR